VIDSHSRDDAGLCTPSGKAVVLQIDSADQLVKYIKDMRRSISNLNLQFEMIPCVINKSNITQINETYVTELRRPSVEPEHSRPSTEQRRPSVEPEHSRPSTEQCRPSVDP
jgi:hypothetical protein